jgi:malate dehydrogenase
VHTIVILGAGELGATLARRLAETECARRIVMVDAEEGRARGKALDIAQSGPLEGFDTRVEGASDLTTAGGFDVLVAAEAAEAAEVAGSGPAARLVETLAAAAQRAPVVIASARPAALVEAVVQRGAPRAHVLGSAAVAWSAAVRRHLAAALEVDPREVHVTVMGLPPRLVVLPPLAGAPVDRLAPAAPGRAREAVGSRAMGPVALAAAAARVVAALAAPRSSVLPVVARLEGEYGQRGPALAVPARLGARRLQSVVEVTLEPSERMAFDNAAGERSNSGGY